MAIALDTSANLGSTATTSLTASYTVTGTNPFLLVSVGAYQSSGSGDIVTGVTYNGVAMTRIGSSLAFSGTIYHATLWYLAAPATGANNVVVSLSSNNNIVYARAVSYTGVDQTSPIDVSDTATATATSISKQITTTVDNDWAMCAVWQATGDLSAGANTTLRTASINLFDSNAVITPAGNITLNVNNTASSDMGMIITSFKPFVAGGGFFQLL